MAWINSSVLVGSLASFLRRGYMRILDVVSMSGLDVQATSKEEPVTSGGGGHPLTRYLQWIERKGFNGDDVKNEDKYCQASHS